VTAELPAAVPLTVKGTWVGVAATVGVTGVPRVAVGVPGPGAPAVAGVPGVAAVAVTGAVGGTGTRVPVLVVVTKLVV
jgi:hypothetical protein